MNRGVVFMCMLAVASAHSIQAASAEVPFRYIGVFTEAIYNQDGMPDLNSNEADDRPIVEAHFLAQKRAAVEH